MSTTPINPHDPDAPAVRVSGAATKALATYLRRWSGWDKANIKWEKPADTSPYGRTSIDKREIVININALVLNPNRIINNVTPFRLRQEAVLTGVMLHEAGHARHSHWLPNGQAIHSDGDTATRQTVALAQLLEEPRIEALMARDESLIGATGLGWTMRAWVARLMPMTDLSLDPNQQVMDLLCSWIVRAGRAHALRKHTGRDLPRWVKDFDSLLHATIMEHLSITDSSPSVVGKSLHIIDYLRDTVSLSESADTGSAMLDAARYILGLLFPETPPEDQPMAGGGCGAEAGEQGEEDESEAETAEQAGSGTEAQPEDAEPGDGTGEGEDEASEAEGSGSGEAGDEAGEDEAEDYPGLTNAQANAYEDLKASLEDILKASDDESKADEEKSVTEIQAPLSTVEQDAEKEKSNDAGVGSSSGNGGGWRNPDADERGVQREAEGFLRSIIDPTETLHRSISESPSSTIDAAALAAWKAGGQTRDPRFFVRSSRTVMPAPPVKMAVLVDVSGSMEALQAPSALLSWSIAAAALDLRNFAGGGNKIETTLIHWGSSARVIQRNGETLPGIREVPCLEGTDALHEALALVEAEIPGFFDPSPTPEHRLLVNFTDWRLARYKNQMDGTIGYMSRGFEVGVNLLSVVPHDYSHRWSSLPDIIKACPIQRGKNTMAVYDRRRPGSVWQQAAASLAT